MYYIHICCYQTISKKWVLQSSTWGYLFIISLPRGVWEVKKLNIREFVYASQYTAPRHLLYVHYTHTKIYQYYLRYSTMRCLIKSSRAVCPQSPQSLYVPGPNILWPQRPMDRLSYCMNVPKKWNKNEELRRHVSSFNQASIKYVCAGPCIVSVWSMAQSSRYADSGIFDKKNVIEKWGSCINGSLN